MWATTTKDNHFLLTVGSTDIKLVLVEDENKALMFRRYLSPNFIQRNVQRDDMTFATTNLEDQPARSQGTWHLGCGAYQETDNPDLSQLAGRYFFANGMDASTPGVIYTQQAQSTSTMAANTVPSAPDKLADYAGNVYVGKRAGTNISYTTDAGLNWSNVGTMGGNTTGWAVHNNVLYIAHGSSVAYDYVSTPGTFTTTAHVTASTRTANDSKAELFLSTQNAETGEYVLWKFLNPDYLQFSTDGSNGGLAWSTIEHIGDSGSGTGVDYFVNAWSFAGGILIGKKSGLYYRSADGLTQKIFDSPVSGTNDNYLFGTVHPGTGFAYLSVQDKDVLEVRLDGSTFQLKLVSPRLFGPRVTFLNQNITWIDSDHTWVYVQLGYSTSYVSMKGRYYFEEQNAPWAWHGSFLRLTAPEHIIHPVVVSNTPYLALVGSSNGTGNGRRVLNWPAPLTQGGTFTTNPVRFWTTHMDFGLRQTPKLARRAFVDADNTGVGSTLKLWYNADNDNANTLTDGTALTTLTTSSKIGYDDWAEFPIGAQNHRLQLELTATNGAAATSWVVRGVTYTAAIRPQRMVVWDMYVRLDQETMLLGGTLSPTNVEGVFNQFFDPDSSTGIIYDASNTFILTESMLANDKFAVEIDTAEVVFVRDAHGEPQAVLHLILKEIKGATS